LIALAIASISFCMEEILPLKASKKVSAAAIRPY